MPGGQPDRSLEAFIGHCLPVAMPNNLQPSIIILICLVSPESGFYSIRFAAWPYRGVP